MADNTAFSYEDLFADDLPDAPPRGGTARAKYDFAVAYPAPETLPLDGIVDALKDGLRDEGRDLAVYPHPQGYTPLREYVAGKLARDRDIHVSADDIVLADGSSQPIHMLAEVLVNPGDVVLTEHFVYSGTLATLRRFGADIRGVACDDGGMLPDALRAAIDGALSDGKAPKIIYTIPTFQNPLGFTMSLERRKEMLEIAYATGVPILEDDCYVDLRYEGEDVTSIHSLDDRGMVMYVASFSKIIAPGLRMGYMTAPAQLLDKARSVKSGGGVNQFAALAVPPLRHGRPGRAHRRGQRPAAGEAGRHARGPGGELRIGSQVESARGRAVHLAGDAGGRRSGGCPAGGERGRSRLSAGARLRSGRGVGQELCAPVLRLQHSRGDTRGDRPPSQGCSETSA